MKADNTIPLVGHPENITTPGPRQWPGIASDHDLPLRHARTEAVIIALLVLLILVAALIALSVRDLSMWGLSVFVAVLVFLLVFLRRYEDHVAYVRSDRAPVMPDLDRNGEPDTTVHGVWYTGGNGAPLVAADSLDGIYRVSFADFCATAQRVGTTVRALAAEGFNDALYALFKNWLLLHGGANLLPRGQWELAAEDELRRVLRNTGWAEDK